MRVLAAVMAIFGLCMLMGCGGGGGDAAPSTGGVSLAGTWLDVRPGGAAVAPSVRGIGWPSRLLTMDADSDYRFEDAVTTSWVHGRYRVTGDTVRFARSSNGGVPTFFSESPVGFAFFDEYLAISEQSYDGTLAMQLSKCISQYPAQMNTEWVLVRLLTAEGDDLPCTTPARLAITTGAAVTLTTYDMAAGRYAATPGTMLITQSGHIGLRTERPTGSGDALSVLGACTLDTNGAMATVGPTGTRCLYVARNSPTVELVGVWEWSTDDASHRLALNADGTYQHETAAGTERGQWRTYANKHLALTAASPQARLRVCGWKLSVVAGQRILTIREWTIDDGAPGVRESVWTPAS